MSCPHCGHENIQGADQCAQCETDLTFLDTEPPATDEMERMIVEAPVRALKPRSPVLVAPQTPLQDVISKMIAAQTECLLVMEAKGLIGIFTERDLLVKVAGREQELADRPVRDWMTPEPETIGIDDTIALAIHKMDVGGYRHLPVLEGERPCGLISARDVVHFLAARLSPTCT